MFNLQLPPWSAKPPSSKQEIASKCIILRFYFPCENFQLICLDFFVSVIRDISVVLWVRYLIVIVIVVLCKARRRNPKNLNFLLNFLCVLNVVQCACAMRSATRRRTPFSAIFRFVYSNLFPSLKFLLILCFCCLSSKNPKACYGKNLIFHKTLQRSRTENNYTYLL